MKRNKRTRMSTPQFDKGLIACVFGIAAITGIIGSASVSKDIEKNNREAREVISSFDNAVRRNDYSSQEKAYSQMRYILENTTDNPRDEISNISPQYREQIKKRLNYKVLK